MISCEQTCEYQDKNVHMNDRYRMPSYSILAQSSDVVTFFAVIGSLFLLYNAAKMIYKKIYPSDEFKQIIDQDI